MISSPLCTKAPQESEAEIAKDYSSNDISPGNYNLRFIRGENVGGERCYVLELLPKRKDKNLVWRRRFQQVFWIGCLF